MLVQQEVEQTRAFRLERRNFNREFDMEGTELEFLNEELLDYESLIHRDDDDDAGGGGGESCMSLDCFLAQMPKDMIFVSGNP